MSSYRGGYVWRDSLDLLALNRQIMAARPDPCVPVFGNTGGRTEAPCGTPAANRRHRRRGERPCEACREAETRRHRIRAEARRREEAA